MTELDITDSLDALKVIDLEGEHWSARDLMLFAGYDRWERFSDAINRAIASVDASGLNAADHFRGSAKMVRIGSTARREVEDVDLTRYGCYILFQNADARKPQIAALQSYFAVQTRKQELVSPLSDDEIVQRALQITAARVQVLEAKVAELAPAAAHAEVFRSAEGLCTIGDVANRLKVHAAIHFPHITIRHQDVFDHAGRLGIIIRGDSIRNNQPTAQAIEANWARPHEHSFDTNTRGRQTKVSTRLTPRGEARLFDGVLKYLGQHGTVVTTSTRALQAVTS